MDAVAVIVVVVVIIVVIVAPVPEYVGTGTYLGRYSWYLRIVV